MPDSTLPISVRAATSADVGAIADLLGALGYPAQEASIPARLEKLARPTSIVMVAERQGVAVGLISAHFFPAIHQDELVAWITSLVVGSRARRAGVGAALVEHVERWAVEAGCSRVAIVTAHHRSDAHAFYERLGYEHTGRRYGKSL